MHTKAAEREREKEPPCFSEFKHSEEEEKVKGQIERGESTREGREVAANFWCCAGAGDGHRRGRRERALVIWEEPAICGSLYRRMPGALPSSEQVCFPISNRIASSPLPFPSLPPPLRPVGASIHPLLLLRHLHLRQTCSHVGWLLYPVRHI